MKKLLNLILIIILLNLYHLTKAEEMNSTTDKSLKVSSIADTDIKLQPVEPATTASSKINSSEADMENIVNDLSGKIVSRIFYKKAEVIFRKGSDIYLNIGNNNGIFQKDRLDIFRYTEEIFDPITKKSQGYVEEKVGQIEITVLRDKSSIAKIIFEEEGKKISIGDWIRNIKGTSVVFLGLSGINPKRQDAFSREIGSLLISKLKQENNFSLIVDEKTEGIKDKFGLNKYNGFISPELAKAIAKELSADIVITGKIMDMEENIYFNFQIINGKTGEIFSVIEKNINKNEKIAHLIQTKIEQKRELFSEDFLTLNREVSFPYKIMDFVIDDIDGDKTNEFIALTPSDIKIFHLGIVFEETISFNYSTEALSKIKSREKIGHIIVTDFNKNGKKEIAISNGQISGGGIFEWNDDHFQKLIDLKDWIINGIGKKPYTALLTCDFLGGRNYYTGDSIKYLFVDSQNELKTVETSLPSDFYSLAVINKDSDEDEKEWIVLDNNGALTIFGIDNKKIWQSGEMFGIHIETADINDNGKPEIVLTSNEPVTKNSKDYIYVLECNGIGPILRWKSQEIDGSILKFHFGDIDNDNKPELVTIKEKDEKTYIQIFKVNISSAF